MKVVCLLFIVFLQQSIALYFDYGKPSDSEFGSDQAFEPRNAYRRNTNKKRQFGTTSGTIYGNLETLADKLSIVSANFDTADTVKAIGKMARTAALSIGPPLIAHVVIAGAMKKMEDFVQAARDLKKLSTDMFKVSLDSMNNVRLWRQLNDSATELKIFYRTKVSGFDVPFHAVSFMKIIQQYNSSVLTAFGPLSMGDEIRTAETGNFSCPSGMNLTDDQRAYLTSELLEFSSGVADVKEKLVQVAALVYRLVSAVSSLLRNQRDLPLDRRNRQGGVVVKVTTELSTAAGNLSAMAALVYHKATLTLDGSTEVIMRALKTLDRVRIDLQDEINGNHQYEAEVHVVVEKQTRESRQCRRKLRELLAGGEQLTLKNLLDAKQDKYSGYFNADKTLAELKSDSQSCWNAHHFVYDPPHGAGLARPRGIFDFIVHNFYHFHPDDESELWSYKKPAETLKTIKQITHLLFLEVINLYFYNSIQGAADFVNKMRGSRKFDDEMSASLQTRLAKRLERRTDQLIRSFSEQFPPCFASRQFQLRFEIGDITCSRPEFIDSPPLLPQSCYQSAAFGDMGNTICHRQPAHQMGTLCSLRCNTSSDYDPFICGPNGRWSIRKREFAKRIEDCFGVQIEDTQAYKEEIQKLEARLRWYENLVANLTATLHNLTATVAPSLTTTESEAWETTSDDNSTWATTTYTNYTWEVPDNATSGNLTWEHTTTTWLNSTWGNSTLGNYTWGTATWGNGTLGNGTYLATPTGMPMNATVISMNATVMPMNATVMSMNANATVKP